METELWITAAGEYTVASTSVPLDKEALKEHNYFNDEDDTAIWVTGTDIIDSPAFGVESSRARSILRRWSEDEEGQETQITIAINPAHVYAVRSTYTSTKRS